MKLSRSLSMVMSIATLSGLAVSHAVARGEHAWKYPEAPRGDTVDTYFGVSVADPYRWLENPDSPESQAWIEAQNKITQAYIAGVPQRQAIESRITQLFNFERFGIPFKEAGRVFYSYNSGLQNQSVIYVMDSESAEPRVLLDPNTLREDGTAALSGLAMSDKGRYMAYGIAEAGSDWNTWRVRDIATGKDTEDVLNWVKFSGASFTACETGFFYSRFDEPASGEKDLRGSNFYQKLYFHKMGTPQSQDILVYHTPEEAKKDWGFGGAVTEDGRYLIINVWIGTNRKNRVYYKELNPTGVDVSTLGNQQVFKLLDAFDASYEFVGNDGATFYFTTDLNAPRGRLIAIDTTRPEPSNWKELIPQSDATLTGVSLVGNNFFANYLRDARSEVKVHDLAGKFVRNVDLPGIGSAGGFGGKRTDTTTYYSFSGFTTPTRIYKYDLATGTSTLFREAKVAFNPDDYSTEQVFYTSKDGTRVPMFITSKKGTPRDGTNPTLLYAYGGFNISVTPSFSVSNLVWMEMGGIYASANIRGGGEYGEEWHKTGTKLQKQNVFDDFIAAGEYLIDNKYTSNKKLAIRGGSNGGLLVGAVINQRPELFGAALPEVGVLDMLRFHKFTIGHAWSSDYGNADESKEMFEYLRAYSPYHNVRQGVCYPATMIMTADHDDRVVPAHSFKFAAALQEAQGKVATCDNPALIRIETRAGHGAGKPTAKIIEEAADRWAFLVRALGMNPRIGMGEGGEGQAGEAMAQAGQPVLRTVALKVDGMKCGMCKASVERTLQAVKGVKSATVDLDTKIATCQLDDASLAVQDLINAFEGTHFTVTTQ